MKAFMTRKLALPIGFTLTLLASAYAAPAQTSPAAAQGTVTNGRARDFAAEVREFVSFDQPLIAITHVRVIDGTGGPPADDQTVVLHDARIERLGPSSRAPAPAGATVLEKRGYTVLPGLVGMHDHLFYPSGKVPVYNEQAFSFPRLYLAGGVTTIRTTGSIEPYTDLTLKQWIDSGKMAGPRMFITGPYLEGRGAFTAQMHELADADDARRTVEYWSAEGVTSFKAYMHITHAELAAAIQAAHAHGIKVTGHLCSVGFREAAELSIDGLEHGIVEDSEFTPNKQPDQCPEREELVALQQLDISSQPVQAMIAELVRRHVAVTSTLPVLETFVPGRIPAPQRVLDALLPETRDAFLTRRETINHRTDSPWPALFQKEMQFERAFARAGGQLMAGEDPTGYGGVLAGFGDQREIELLVEAGFTPLEAIHIASANGAQWLGETANLGTIAPGKQADLLLVHGDPSSRISDIENVETVFKDGIGYDSAKLIASVRGSVGLH
jgi:imidazolonepropionase-like amidohydrolase